MEKKSNNRSSWRTFLPEVYHWIENVKIDHANKPVSDAIHVVPVRVKRDDSESKFEILSEVFDKNVKLEISQAWKKSGWLGQSSHFLLTSTTQRYLLIPVSGLSVTPAQISRQFGLDTARALKELSSTAIAFCFSSQLAPYDLIDGLSLGFYDAGLFKGSKFASGNKKAKAVSSLPEKISFYGWEKKDLSNLSEARAMAQSAAFMRMLQDAPANWLTPSVFGDIASDISKQLGMKCKLLGKKELEQLGAGSMLSVTHGSVNEPRLIAVEIAGKNTKKTAALVGKGLTFDSGGISIKPSAGMGEMKYDMSGGAAVLAAAHYLGVQKPAQNVVCIIGAVENMPGPAATKPGDIVVAMNGKTIDVQNTDAEGRLVLADLLHYTNVTYKPDFMVNIATLTGACLHALGHVGAAVMSNDDALANRILTISREVGEPLWQLPLWPEFTKEVKGEWSDLVNIAKPNVQAGTIIGGVFLAEFVGSTKWAHLDVAGTAWSCKTLGLPSSGGSSFAVRTLVNLCN